MCNMMLLRKRLLPLEEINNFADVAEGEGHGGVGSAVVDGQFVALGECGTGEDHVGHVALEFIGSGGGEKVVHGTVEYARGFVPVEQGSAHGVAVAVARGDHAVIEKQPALFGEDGHGAGTDFGALPSALFEGHGTHHVAVFAPVFHVGGVTDEDVAKGGVSVVARAGEHGVASAYLLRKEHTVAVEGEEGILALMEGAEVVGVANAYGGPVVSVAPGYPVAVADAGHAGVVFVVGLDHVGVSGFETNGVGIDAPMYAVVAKPGENVHLHPPVVAAKHAGEAVAKGDYCAIEYAVGRGDVVAVDNGVVGVAPHDVGGAFGPFLPGNGVLHRGNVGFRGIGFEYAECVLRTFWQKYAIRTAYGHIALRKKQGFFKWKLLWLLPPTDLTDFTNWANARVRLKNLCHL